MKTTDSTITILEIVNHNGEYLRTNDRGQYGWTEAGFNNRAWFDTESRAEKQRAIHGGKIISRTAPCINVSI